MPPKKSPRRKRIVLFLGAGASVYYGYPLTNRILSDIWKGLNISVGQRQLDTMGRRRG